MFYDDFLNRLRTVVKQIQNVSGTKCSEFAEKLALLK